VNLRLDRSQTNRSGIKIRSTAVDPLVLNGLDVYSQSMLRRLSISRRSFLVISAALIVATAVGSTWGVASMWGVLEEAFRDRSLAYVQAFASSTMVWLDPPNPEMLDAASRFMLVGSALYVQVVQEETILSDARVVDLLDVSLSVGPAPPSARIERRAIAGTAPLLDVTVPLPSLGNPSAYVRIGIDESTLRTRKRNAALGGTGIGLGLDAVLLGLLWWILRSREGADSVLPDPAVADAEPARSARKVGSLSIDPASCSVSLSGVLVKLTPKQYTLLGFLASEPDRVFSDREILSAVWSDSPYADSKDVKQYVYLLRKRLESAQNRGAELIDTVPGFGYRLRSTPIDATLTDE